MSSDCILSPWSARHVSPAIPASASSVLKDCTFINEVTGERENYHPLRSVFLRLAKLQVSRLHSLKSSSKSCYGSAVWVLLMLQVKHARKGSRNQPEEDSAPEVRVIGSIQINKTVLYVPCTPDRCLVWIFSMPSILRLDGSSPCAILQS